MIRGIKIKNVLAILLGCAVTAFGTNEFIIANGLAEGEYQAYPSL